MTQYLGDKLISGVAYPTEPTRNLGQIIESIVPLTDAGLHLLDGALINGSGIYADFVTAIGDIYDGGNYPDLFETEANWQTSVTTYGVCGKFVYDSVNNTVRLPKITGILEGTTDVTALGDLVEAGLPNITGGIGIYNSGNTYGATYWNGNNVQGTSITGAGTANGHVAFDASRSSSIYGNSSTVQPQTIKVLYYIVVATSAKTDIQVDIDEISTDLNGKCDVDGTNATFAHIIDTYVNGTSGYIVYSNGWCKQWGIRTGNGSYTHIQVTLYKKYKDTNYMIYGHKISWSSENNSWYTSSGTVGQSAMLDIIGTPSNTGNKAVGSFMMPSASHHTWITEGFLAEGEY